MARALTRNTYRGYCSVKSALLGHLALCACPPLIAVTAATAVPQVRHAVHRATAPKHHHHPSAHTDEQRRADCVVRRRTDASPAGSDTFLHDLTNLDGPEPQTGEVQATAAENGAQSPSNRGAWNTSSPLFPIGPGGGWIGTQPGGPGAPTNPTGPVGPNPPLGAVPEPASWAFMLLGFGGIGGVIRSGKRTKSNRALVAGSAPILAAAVDVGTGTSLASAKVATFGLHAARAVALKKIGVCVCSAAALVTTATTVSQVRHALYAATAPAVERAPLSKPCSPAIVAGEASGDDS